MIQNIKWFNSKTSTYFISDLVGISFSAYFALIARFGAEESLPTIDFYILQFDYLELLVVLALGWVLSLIMTGAYDSNRSLNLLNDLQILTKCSVIYFFALGFTSFVFRASFSRVIFVLFFIAGLFSIFTCRFIVHLLIIRPKMKKREFAKEMLLVGRDSQEIKQYSEWISDNPSLGYTVVARIKCLNISLDWLSEFDRILKLIPFDEILFLPGMESDKYFSRFVHYCEDLGIKVNWIPLESGNLGYWLIPQPNVGSPFLTFSHSRLGIYQRAFKRIFDIFFSITALVLMLPLFVIISTGIIMGDGFPVFYVQKRVGIRGKSFNFYKFRSMVKNAEAIRSEANNVHGNRHILFKDVDDPRVTPFGRILRRYSLDELPQFLNVLRNDMSVVGPRPALVSEVQLYDSIYERRLNVKPGVTGPWQISGRSDLDLQTSVALDLNYLVNWSFTRDLWIIIATIGAVIRGRGAY